ncbi:MAG: DUF1194 domain-containing protein, partial [Pseudolabrys sp.]|nr:DUF1194 domain-containing protein [Pseudolabrys sp.]
DWTVLRDEEGAGAVAATMLSAPRSFLGRTSISAAIDFSMARLGVAPVGSDKRIIDISGDGMANFGAPPAAARDRVVAAGISINGLAILTEEPWLDGYYRSNVIGGEGAFVVVARSFDNFADAMLRKLVQEVAGVAPADHLQMQ